MPLDAGDIEEGQNVRQPDDRLAALRPIRVVLSTEGHVGEALKGARVALGLLEDDIAQATRVRAAYITAIEAFNFDAMPARPFVVGYVRAYARALGLEAEAVVNRFRAEAPDVDGRLRAPGGVRHDGFAAIRWLLVAGGAVASAVVIWNVARRVELRASAAPDAPIHAVAPPRPPVGLAQIGAPLPTPPEATTPPVYQTPGLTVAGAAPAAAGTIQKTAPASGQGLTDGAPGAPFTPGGTIYGAAPTPTAVTLQARKPTSFIVRGSGGAVYFARVLATGEAWRSPALEGLTVDVGDPGSVEVFVGGVSRGRLLQAQTPLSHLAAP